MGSLFLCPKCSTFFPGSPACCDRCGWHVNLPIEQPEAEGYYETAEHLYQMENFGEAFPLFQKSSGLGKIKAYERMGDCFRIAFHQEEVNQIINCLCLGETIIGEQEQENNFNSAIRIYHELYSKTGDIIYLAKESSMLLLNYFQKGGDYDYKENVYRTGGNLFKYIELIDIKNEFILFLKIFYKLIEKTDNIHAIVEEFASKIQIIDEEAQQAGEDENNVAMFLKEDESRFFKVHVLLLMLEIRFFNISEEPTSSWERTIFDLIEKHGYYIDLERWKTSWYEWKTDWREIEREEAEQNITNYNEEDEDEDDMSFLYTDETSLNYTGENESYDWREDDDYQGEDYDYYFSDDNGDCENVSHYIVEENDGENWTEKFV